MSNFKPGDRVRITFEAKYDQDRGTHSWVRDINNGETIAIPKHGIIELIERADDPAKDPVGTVRTNTGTYSGAYVKLGRSDGKAEWRHVTHDFPGYRETLGPIIGAVPGTPAASVERPSPHLGRSDL